MKRTTISKHEKPEKSGNLLFSVQLSDECAAQQHEYLNLKSRKDENADNNPFFFPVAACCVAAAAKKILL